MKRSKEYKISIGAFSTSLVLYCISIVTGLIPVFSFSIDKLCMYLGFSFFGLGLVFLNKAKDNNDNTFYMSEVKNNEEN